MFYSGHVEGLDALPAAAIVRWEGLRPDLKERQHPASQLEKPGVEIGLPIQLI